jgi:cobalt ECF transporter T component CbiQ
MSRSFATGTLRAFTRTLEPALAGEQTALRRGALQALDPRVRLAGVLLLVAAATLCHRWQPLAALLALTLVLAAASRLNRTLLRLWVVALCFAAFLALPALFFTPGAELWRWHALAIHAPGLRAAILLTLRTLTTVALLSTLLAASLWTHILKALRGFGLPAELVLMLAMTHRYIYLLIKMTEQMLEARQSRSLGRLSRAQERRAAARTAGALLGKSMDLSQEVYEAMISRGFRGDVRLLLPWRLRTVDRLAMLAFAATAALCVWQGR